MRSFLKRVSTALVFAVAAGSFPFTAMAGTGSSFETLRFDFGSKGTASGYIGVKAEDKYSEEKGYGFTNTDAVENVSASGKGALSDAVRFISNVPGHVFNVDLPKGVYKMTVTTGDVKSAVVTAEGYPQMYFLTGNNAVESFSIPVTDGQLNIYTSFGVGDNYSFSTLEIDQVSTGTKTKPTIWIYGDSTVCNYYNVSDEHAHGWGQYLYKYIDTKTYDVRNMAISGMDAVSLAEHVSFEVSENYGKSGDILVLSIGINDYRRDTISASQYKSAMTDLVKRAKAKNMKVYLVKQQGMLNDFKKYPEQTKQWYSDEIDAVAKAENVSTLDLYSLWTDFCLQKTYKVVPDYYQTSEDGKKNEIHLNKKGADVLSGMMAGLLFPESRPGETNTPTVTPTVTDVPGTVIYKTEASGEPVTNPHKGYVMNVQKPYQFDSDYSAGTGIGGSKNNKAWDVVTLISGVYYWNDLNPEEDKYNWSEIDAMLDACEKHGMTYGLRVVPYTTASGNDENYGAAYNFVPQWVFDKGATMDDATYKSGTHAGNHIYIPTWSNQVYIDAHKKFIKALAEKYDGDPRLEYVEIRAFGNFGEWHTSQFTGNDMPSVEQQKDMIGFYKSVFKKTTLCAMSDVRGEVYDHAISLGIAKRNNGLVMGKNEEYDLVPAYEAGLETMGDYHNRYTYMRDIDEDNPSNYQKWTPERFRHVIETAHLSVFSLDNDSTYGYDIYREQKSLIDEYVNRLGYNYTVTSAKRSGNKLTVKIKNTGLASSFFNIDLCAEITDAKGNKLASFGNSVKIKKASFKDGTEKTFEFVYNGTLKDGDVICLAMYDCDNPLVKGKDPTVRFDNNNILQNNRLKLEVKEVVEAKNTAAPTQTASVTPLPDLTSAPEEKAVPAEPTIPPMTEPSVTAAPVISQPAKVLEVDGNKVKVSGDSAEVVEVAERDVVAIPSEVSEDGKNYKVTSISDKAFAGNLKITKIHIGDNITKIGDKAFLNCKNLKTVTGGKSVEVIGKAAFKNCSSLKSVTIGPKVRSIGKDAFRGCKNLKKVTVKSKFLKKKKVGTNAFRDIAKRAVFKLPKSRYKVYKPVFRKVSKGTKISFKKI